MMGMKGAVPADSSTPGGTPAHASLEQRFECLYEANRGRIARIASSYASASDQHDLEQEILLQLWRSLPSFAGRATGDTWVYRVALNTALTYRRRDRVRQRHHARNDAQATAEHTAAPQEDAVRELRMLRIFLASLSPVERGLMLLYLEDLSYRQIAEILGLNENLVGVKVHRLKKRFTERFLGSS